jgi:hypothetical protein
MVYGKHRIMFFFSESLLDPSRPMALRLTSNLMIGIARIYYQQYSYYAADVNQVLMQLKRISYMTYDMNPKEITLQQPIAR